MATTPIEFDGPIAVDDGATLNPHDFDEPTIVYDETVKKTWTNTVISSTDSVMGTDAADEFTISEVTVTSGGNLGIYSAGGVDTILANNVTINGGEAYLEGGADADTISVANVSVTGSNRKFYVEGNDGADKITVTDSNGVQITSGDGADTLYFGGDVQGTISDYTAADDVISLSGEYNQAYYKDGVFIYGTGVKVSLGGVSDISSIGSGVIYNGSTRTNFNDFVTVLEWKLENGVASYSDLITISGLSSLASFEDLTIDGKAINTLDDEEIKELGGEITIAQNALTSLTAVEITEGFTLALGADVTDIPEDIPEHWEVSEGNAAYFATGTSAGFVANGNEIFYRSQITGDVVTEINGLSNNATISDISLSGRRVTISENALVANSDNTVTINDGYTLALAKDVTQAVETAEGWQVSKGVAEYQTANNTAGYKLENNQISYLAAVDPETLVTVTGLKTTAKAANLSFDGSTVSIAATAVNKGEVTITEGYAVVFEKGSYANGASLTGGAGVDSITQNGNNLLISTGAGDDVITLAKNTSNNTIVGGTGNDSVYGGNDNDKLQGDAGNDTLNGGLGNDTLIGGAGADVFIYEGGNDVITDYASGQDSIKVKGTISNVSYKSKNVIFTIGNESLTVNNAKGKDITVTNINNQTQTYCKALDLLYDNNFVSEEFGIDSISEVTEKNYSLGEIEYFNNNNELANNSIVSVSSFDEK